MIYHQYDHQEVNTNSPIIIHQVTLHASYTMETQATTDTPLNNNIEAFMVFSEGVHVSVGTFYMPGSMSDGQLQFFI